MKTIFCRICWMKKYNGIGKLQCVHMDYEDEHGGEMWNFHSAEKNLVHGYVMLTAKNKGGEYPGTININTLGASTKDKSIDNVKVIFFAMSPVDKKNYVVGWYESAKVYRNWKSKSIPNDEPWEERSFSFEAKYANTYLIPESKRKITIVTAKSKEAIKRGGSFPGQSNVFFGNSNESYTHEIFNAIQADNLERDLEKIEATDNITDTEKQRLVSTRVGQGWFRNQLIKYWGECAITGCDDVSVLRASHIKPWSVSNNQERLDVYNGLLLSPNLDVLFDKGYIGFDDSGKIIISEKITDANIKKLGVNRDLQISLVKKHIKFLRWHRRYVLGE